MKTKHDDGLEWLREVRRKLAKKFNHNPKVAAAYYQQKQKELGVRIYHPVVPTTDLQAHDALHDRVHAEIAANECASLASYRANRKRKAKRVK